MNSHLEIAHSCLYFTDVVIVLDKNRETEDVSNNRVHYVPVLYPLPPIFFSHFIIINPYLIQLENHQIKLFLLYTHTSTNTEITQSNEADTCKILQSCTHEHTVTHTHTACRNTPQSCVQRGWTACMCVRVLLSDYISQVWVYAAVTDYTQMN